MNIYNIIPKSVLFNDIFICRNIRDVIHFSRTNKNHYIELMQSCKGLWSHSVDSPSSGPMLPLFRLIDGLQILFSAKASLKQNESLLRLFYQPSHNSFKFIYASISLCGSFTASLGELSENSIKAESYFILERNLENWLNGLEKIEYDVLRAKVLLLLNALAGILDMGPLFYLAGLFYVSSFSLPIALGSLIVGSLFLLYVASNRGEVIFGEFLTPIFRQEMNQCFFNSVYRCTVVCSCFFFYSFIMLVSLVNLLT